MWIARLASHQGSFHFGSFDSHIAPCGRFYKNLSAKPQPGVKGVPEVSTLEARQMSASGKAVPRGDPRDRRQASMGSSNCHVTSLEEVAGSLLGALSALVWIGCFASLKKIWKELNKLKSRVNAIEDDMRTLNSGLQAILYPMVRGAVFDDFMAWVLEAELAYGKRSEAPSLGHHVGRTSIITEAELIACRSGFATYVTGLKDKPDELAWVASLANEHGGGDHTPESFMDLLTFCMKEAESQDPISALTVLGGRYRAAPRVTAAMVEKSILCYTLDRECKAKLKALFKIANPESAL